jgi:hypothetical protein
MACSAAPRSISVGAPPIEFRSGGPLRAGFYELWLVGRHGRVSVGTVRIGRDGGADARRTLAG